MLIRFFVPTRGNNGVKGEGVRNWLETELASLYGGATSHPSTGIWFSPEQDKMIREAVYVVESEVPKEATHLVMGTAKELAESIKAQLAQESVMFSVLASDVFFV